MRDAVIVSAVRTAVGKAPSGTLRFTRPDEMGAVVIGEALKRAAGVQPAEVDDVIMGCAMPEAEQGLNVARIASLRAGVPVSASAVTVNRFCSSGLQSIAYAAERIMAGFADTIVAGGTESMSLVPMGGHKVAPNPALVDSYPDVYLTTGLVAENHAREASVSRDEQDAFALRSHQRALAAIDAGRFKDEIVPLSVAAPGNGGSRLTFDTDEGPRRDTSAEALAKLKPAFHVKGTVTAGNSSQTSDGAAAVVVMSAERAKALGLQPLARFVGFATAGVEPERFGIGPVPAIRKALARAGLCARSDRPDRAQRGLRSPGHRVPARAANRPRSAERQRRRHRAGPPTRVHRRQADRNAAARDAPAPCAIRHGHDVRRRRHGRRGNIRVDSRESLVVSPEPRSLRLRRAEPSPETESREPRRQPMSVLETTTKGGAFLIEDVTPERMFTPEKMTDEHRLIGQTADEFLTTEVMPVLERLEQKDWALARTLIQRCGGAGTARYRRSRIARRRRARQDFLDHRRRRRRTLCVVRDDVRSCRPAWPSRRYSASGPKTRNSVICRDWSAVR